MMFSFSCPYGFVGRSKPPNARVRCDAQSCETSSLTRKEAAWKLFCSRLGGKSASKEKMRALFTVASVEMWNAKPLAASADDKDIALGLMRQCSSDLLKF